jgi:phosphotransferase system IIA component
MNLNSCINMKAQAFTSGLNARDRVRLSSELVQVDCEALLSKSFFFITSINDILNKRCILSKGIS